MSLDIHPPFKSIFGVNFEENNMRLSQSIVIIAAVGVLAGCETGTRSVTDRGLDRGPLVDGNANVWVDPDGCQHWVIDDGVEGFMSPRLHPDGTPHCQDSRGSIVLKDGTRVPTEQEPSIPTG